MCTAWALLAGKAPATLVKRANSMIFVMETLHLRKRKMERLYSWKKLTVDKYNDGSIAFLEMQVSVHKTMFAFAKRFRFLDLAATGRGVHGDSWAQHWLGNLRARLLVGEKETRSESARKISSHSLKCNMLPYAAKRGPYAAKRGFGHQDRLSTRRHAHPMKMADTYGQDAQARSLRLIDSLIKSSRRFDLDTFVLMRAELADW